MEVLAHSQAQVDQMNDLLDKLYREEQEETRQLLQNLIWEMPSELEEWSYRWRGARLEDLGFADPQESLLIYAYLDPGSVTPDERTADQSLKSDAEPVGRISGALTVQGPASDGSFWSRATVALEDEAERERISQALLSLANRALAADRVSPGDTEAVQASLNDLHWRLSIGLEQICKGDLSRSGAALSGIALIRLARVGHSLGLDLHRALLPLQRAGKLGPRPGNAARLDPPLRHQVEALLRPRPRFLDDKTGQTRAFRGLSDLKESRRWVQAAEASVLIMDRLSLPDPFPADASLGDIFRTRLVNLMLDRDDGPLDRDALGRFIDRHISGHKLDNDARLAAAALAERGGVTPSFVDGWLQVLESSLGPLDRVELDLRFIDGLWLLGDQPG